MKLFALMDHVLKVKNYAQLVQVVSLIKLDVGTEHVKMNLNSAINYLMINPFVPQTIL